MKITST
jgi:hypothetical protein